MRIHPLIDNQSGYFQTENNIKIFRDFVWRDSYFFTDFSTTFQTPNYFHPLGPRQTRHFDTQYCDKKI